jgi:3-oxoadipate enol-lactonase
MWDDQVRQLNSRYMVIRYVLRGHGQSTRATEPFTAHGDLAALLDELGIERTALIGLSAGARVAVDFAITHPERVGKLLLAAPSISGVVPQEKILSKAIPGAEISIIPEAGHMVNLAQPDAFNRAVEKFLRGSH